MAFAGRFSLLFLPIVLAKIMTGGKEEGKMAGGAKKMPPETMPRRNGRKRLAATVRSGGFACGIGEIRANPREIRGRDLAENRCENR